MLNLQMLRDKYVADIIQLATECSVRNVRLIGSVARGDHKVGSDIDFLVEADHDSDILDFQDRLQCMLGIHVDVVVESEMPPAFAAHFLHEAVILNSDQAHSTLYGEKINRISLQVTRSLIELDHLKEFLAAERTLTTHYACLHALKKLNDDCQRIKKSADLDYELVDELLWLSDSMRNTADSIFVTQARIRLSTLIPALRMALKNAQTAGY